MDKLLARCPVWFAAPLTDREYRRLLIWSYGLMARVWMLDCVVMLAAPFATRLIATFLRRRMKALSAEVAALRLAIRQHSRSAPPLNPWA